MLPAVQLGKKRAARRPQKLASASPAGASLIFLSDSVSGKRFLVDTGAALSVFPHISKRPSFGPKLIGADGRPIPAWGRQQMRLSFSGTVFSHEFVLQ